MFIVIGGIVAGIPAKSEVARDDCPAGLCRGRGRAATDTTVRLAASESLASIEVIRVDNGALRIKVPAISHPANREEQERPWFV